MVRKQALAGKNVIILLWVSFRDVGFYLISEPTQNSRYGLTPVKLLIFNLLDIQYLVPS